MPLQVRKEYTSKEGTKYRTLESTTPIGSEDQGGYQMEKWNPALNGGKGGWQQIWGESYYANSDREGDSKNFDDLKKNLSLDAFSNMEGKSDEDFAKMVDQVRKVQSARLYERSTKDMGGGDEYLKGLEKAAYGLQHDRPWNPSDRPDYPVFDNMRETWDQYQKRVQEFNAASNDDWQKSGNYIQDANGKWQSKAYVDTQSKIKAYKDWKAKNPNGNSADFEKTYKPGAPAPQAASDTVTTPAAGTGTPATGTGTPATGTGTPATGGNGGGVATQTGGSKPGASYDPTTGQVQTGGAKPGTPAGQPPDEVDPTPAGGTPPAGGSTAGGTPPSGGTGPAPGDPTSVAPAPTQTGGTKPGGGTTAPDGTQTGATKPGQPTTPPPTTPDTGGGTNPPADGGTPEPYDPNVNPDGSIKGLNEQEVQNFEAEQSRLQGILDKYPSWSKEAQDAKAQLEKVQSDFNKRVTQAGGIDEYMKFKNKPTGVGVDANGNTIPKPPSPYPPSGPFEPKGWPPPGGNEPISYPPPGPDMIDEKTGQPRPTGGSPEYQRNWYKRRGLPLPPDLAAPNMPPSGPGRPPTDTGGFLTPEQQKAAEESLRIETSKYNTPEEYADATIRQRGGGDTSQAAYQEQAAQFKRDTGRDLPPYEQWAAEKQKFFDNQRQAMMDQWRTSRGQQGTLPPQSQPWQSQMMTGGRPNQVGTSMDQMILQANQKPGSALSADEQAELTQLQQRFGPNSVYGTTTADPTRDPAYKRLRLLQDKMQGKGPLVPTQMDNVAVAGGSTTATTGTGAPAGGGIGANFPPKPPQPPIMGGGNVPKVEGPGTNTGGPGVPGGLQSGVSTPSTAPPPRPKPGQRFGTFFNQNKPAGTV